MSQQVAQIWHVTQNYRRRICSALIQLILFKLHDKSQSSNLLLVIPCANYRVVVAYCDRSNMHTEAHSTAASAGHTKSLVRVVSMFGMLQNKNTTVCHH